MSALPRVRNPESWRRRAEAKERTRQSASFERRMQVIATVNLIRSEIRQQRKQEKAA